MKTVKRTLVAAAVAMASALCTLGLAASAHAQEVQLRLGWTSADSETDPYAIGARAFKTAVEEITDGRVEVSLFPNRALGDEKEMVEGIRFGTLDMGIITNAVVANTAPAFQLVDLPFMFGSAEQAHAVLDGEIGEALAEAIADKGIVVLGFMEGGFRNMINNVRPVKSPADVEGVKYRTMQNPVFIEMFESLGGAPVPMAWGETFTAVQQGAIDGLEIPSAVINANNFFEVTDYMSLTRHTYSAIILLISERTYDRLPEDIQAAIVEAAEQAVDVQRETVAANEEKVLDQLAERGMQINEVSDVAPFREAVRPVYDRFRSSIGPDLMDKALQAVN